MIQHHLTIELFHPAPFSKPARAMARRLSRYLRAASRCLALYFSRFNFRHSSTRAPSAESFRVLATVLATSVT